jgi:colanic acid biosynthesis glycosyl transferase WcaI
MKFLIVGLNYQPEPTGIAVYTAGLCEALTNKGHGVHVVTAAPYYPHWKTFSGHRGLKWRRSVEAGIHILRCPIYVPLKVTGLARILHYLSFLFSSCIPVLWLALRHRPDVIMNVAPTLISALPGLIAAKLIDGKSLIHVQDFEVEAGFATEQMASGSLAARLAMRFGDAVIRAHDLATSISPAMVAKLNAKLAPRCDAHELRNWSDISAVVPQEASRFREKWSIQTSFVAIYSGSIGRKQGLETLIDAAMLLAHRGDVTFIICGNGPYRAELERKAAGVGNVQFRDLQPKEQLGDLLSLATVHLLPQKRGAADLVLPSKLTNILASGRPAVVGADPDTGLALEVADCGIVVDPENPDAMAGAISRLLDDPDLRHRLGAAARERALAIWAREPIIDRFLDWLSQVSPGILRTGGVRPHR